MSFKETIMAYESDHAPVVQLRQAAPVFAACGCAWAVAGKKQGRYGGTV